MAVKLISVKCPECGATLNIEEGREQAFCTYCGTKVLLHNENEYIYRHIDEAGVKQAETDRIVRMKQMELAEKKRADAEKTKALKIKISLIMATVGILMMVIGYMGGHASGDPDSGLYMLSMVGFFPLMGAGYIWLFSKKNDDDDDMDLGDKAKVPSSISDYEKKDLAGDMVTQYKTIVDKAFEENRISQQAFYDACNSIILQGLYRSPCNPALGRYAVKQADLA